MSVIDADCHVMEPADLWQRYLEPQFKDRAIRIEEKNGVQNLIIAESTVLSGNLAGLGGAGLSMVEIGRLKYADGCPPASYEPAARIKLMDDWGVDANILFPTIGILPVPTDDMDLISAYCRAYNTWQAEFASGLKGRVIPIAAINWRDIDAAQKELDRCLKLGFKGLFLPPEPVNGRRPGTKYFDPIWNRCAEAGIPVCLHVVVRFSGAGIPFEHWLKTGIMSGGEMLGPTFTFSLGAPGQIMPALTSMITDGLFDRVPKLKVVCVEAGCGWAAFIMDRLDAKHAFFGKIMQKPALIPSDYIRKNVWFVAEPKEKTIGDMLDKVGEDRILWGSDYPHIDSSLDAAKEIRESISGLSPERQKAVLGDNAAKLFGLD